MLMDERIEKYEEESIKLRDQAFIAYYDLNVLSQSRAALIKGRFNLSFAWIIYITIQAINIETAKIFKNPNFKHTIGYRNLFQYEWDDIFEICIKANRLGLTLFPRINTNNDLSYLDTSKQTKLLEIYSEALNKYYDTILKYNVDYLNEETQFLNKMMKFGDNHDMNEADLVQFSTKALQMGFNVADINTQEELEEVYKKVFPEA